MCCAEWCLWWPSPGSRWYSRPCKRQGGGGLSHLQDLAHRLDLLAVCRVVFVVAKPREPALFQAMQEEAAATGDMAVLPGVWEGYHNITHQTLEVFRLAAIIPEVTHVAKVCAPTWRSGAVCNASA